MKAARTFRLLFVLAVLAFGLRVAGDLSQMVLGDLHRVTAEPVPEVGTDLGSCLADSAACRLENPELYAQVWK